jgi:DNA-binding MarR family transcriptional regulator
MEDERAELIEHIAEVSRLLFRHRHHPRQLAGEREWLGVDLTMQQLKVVFVVVSLGGATMSQIAREAGMTLSTATGVADRLVAHGLVRRVSDPEDRRHVWLHPTEEATGLINRLTQIGEAQLRRLASCLSLEELSLVARALDVLYAAMLRATSEEQVSSTRVG